MKLNLILIGFILLTSLTLLANPIMPIYVSEIFVDADNWHIELNSFHYYVDEGDLSGQSFTCSAGTTFINDGVILESEAILVISKDDLVDPLLLNSGADFIEIGEWGYFYELSWGDGNTDIQAPLEGQSIQTAVYSDHDWHFPSSWPVYFLDSQPSIGEEPYCLHSFATLLLQAYDANNLPLSNLDFEFNYEEYGSTDSFGTLTKNIGAKRYHLEGSYNDVAVWDSLVTLYPDSLYQFVIHTDVVSSQSDQINQPIYNISNSPNPFNPVTTISFGRILEQPAKVKIYNSKGGLEDELECSSGKESISWDAGTTASGVYFYKLEVEGNEAGKGKMILLK